MQKLFTLIGCLVFCFNSKNLSAQQSCDSLLMVDLTYKQAKDIRITRDIIYFRKCNDTISYEIKIASKAIKAIIIEGKFIDIHPDAKRSIDQFSTTSSGKKIIQIDKTRKWNFIRPADQKKVTLYKGEKIELKHFKAFKQTKINGFLLDITADSIFVVDKKSKVYTISNQEVTAIKIPKTGANAKKILAVSILVIGGTILLLFIMLWAFIGAFSSGKMRKDNENKIGTGCLFIIFGILGTIGVFYANKDREMKYPFIGEWMVESESKVNNP